MVSEYGIFDFGPDEEVPDDFVDETRNPNFDMARAQEIRTRVYERAERYKKLRNDAEDARDEALKEEKVESSDDRLKAIEEALTRPTEEKEK